MKRVICLFVAACFLAAVWGMPTAKINPLKQKRLISLSDAKTRIAHATASDDSFFNDLHIGASWFPSISNKGYVGYWDLSAYYPGGGDQTNLWQAGMWAGGYVEGRSSPWRYLGSDGGNSDPAQYDALDEQAIVETEDDLGLPYPYRRLTTHVNTAFKPYVVSQGDTVDGDLGMDVKYEWHQWGVSGCDHWIFLQVTIAFSKSIDDFYWGWMSDCDVGDVNVPEMYFDDYAGWDNTYKFAYMRDWDYDPLPGDTIWLSPDAIGQCLLAAPPISGPVSAPPNNTQRWVSKNYWDWTNDVSSYQDWYDRLSGAWENPFPSDSASDYRILTGVGPYDVSAGDTAHFWMAYVIGEGYNEDSHAMYGLGNLVDHVQDAQAFFDGGMVIPASSIPPRAPDLNPDLIADVTDDSLRVHWAPYNNIAGGATADSFIVHTSTISKLGSWERVAAFDNSVTETHLPLMPGFCMYVWVQAYDTGNGVGSNPYALSSRLYKRDANGILRANENTITCVFMPASGVTPTPQVANRLFQNYPNPFNPLTTIVYWISSPGVVDLRVFDVTGRLVQVLANESKAAGEHRVTWDGRDLKGRRVSSGTYFVRLEAGGQVNTEKIVFLK
ncbi:MAG: T9SS type A sorting domain-containing protein [Candidatus Latescibacteria bacterium]|nr:T9SS type A sorting domain-containing protein [Candidatus Latescibacterota bacterium]NIO57408.1 T9SS type A sorting domain-containing protein [Candidatus Latescibacterota bacterium]